MAYVPYPPVGQHGISRSPIVLWQLDGDLTDSSGNGNPVTVIAGTARYSGLLAGGAHKGMYFDSVTSLIRDARVAAFDLVGAMTLECLLFLHQKPTVDYTIISHAASGETQADNYLWSLRVIQSLSANSPCLDSFWEYGSGSNVESTSTYPLPVGQLIHAGLTRTVNGGALDLRFYVNGVLVDTFAGLHVPECSGPTQKTRIGSDDTGASSRATFVTVGSICLIGSALTDAQVLEDARECLPWLP